MPRPPSPRQADVGDFVARARGDGVSWSQIGNALGVTKQAAWAHYGRYLEPQEPTDA